MKKVIIYILCIIVFLLTADFLLGICSRYYLKNYQLTGRYKPLDKLIKEVNTDVILIGNSAILNSLDPQIIEDSLSMTCYNGGIVGQGIDFSETIMDCILQRHTPKMFVLGMRPEEMGSNIGEGIYDVLKPYYKMGYKSIDDHFNQSDSFEHILLQSNLIRYNTIWVRVLLYMFFDNTNYQDNGFMPNNIPSNLPELKTIEKCETPLESKLKCIERIIIKCRERNIGIFICFPPVLMTFEKNPIPCVKAVKNLCTKYDVPCLIDYNNVFFSQHPELFYDNEHVNKNGAELYSKIVSSRMRQLCNPSRK